MFKVLPIPAFNDNYIWALIDTPSKHCVIIDPGDAKPVLDFLDKNQYQLHAVLITHHHSDHYGGLPQLLKSHPVIFYGPEGLINDCIQHDKANSSKFLSDHYHPCHQDETIALFEDRLSLTVIETPGHTLDHIVFYGSEMLFCGDTLFSGGCGRIFEGTYEQMWESLQTLMALPNTTQVYCSHEYTADNLSFALSIEPHNTNIQQALIDAQQQHCTLPSTIGREKKINPFFRTKSKPLQEWSNKDIEFQLFKKIREAKDHWRKK